MSDRKRRACIFVYVLIDEKGLRVLVLMIADCCCAYLNQMSVLSAPFILDGYFYGNFCITEKVIDNVSGNSFAVCLF